MPWFEQRVFLYEEWIGKGGLQISTLAEIDGNNTRFGPRPFFPPSHVIFRGRPSDSLSILRFRCPDTRLEFSYMKTKVTIGKDLLCQKLTKTRGIWTSALFSCTLLRRNPVAQEWNPLDFAIHMPWFNSRFPILRQKWPFARIHFAGNWRNPGPI